MAQEQPVTKRSFVFESLPTTSIIIGQDSGEGHEHPESRFNINVWEAVITYTDHEGVPMNTVASVSLCLTIPQVAEIVKRYFEPATMNYGLDNPRKNVFMGFLDRLLKKRWAVATSPVYRSQNLLTDADRKAMQNVRSALPACMREEATSGNHLLRLASDGIDTIR